MKKLLFTYNPNSGKGAVKAALSDIISTFTTGGYDVMVHPPGTPLISYHSAAVISTLS